MSVVDQIRIDLATGQESDISRHFVNPRTFATTDLSQVRLLGCRVDTVRQLYRGVPDPAVLALFDQVGIVQFGGFEWHAGRVSRDSGYQYKLQNADLGLILLIKAFNSKPDSFGPHLKIEVSPHAIQSMPPAVLQEHMDRLAGLALSRMERNQCAVHLALDFQGWTPPSDLANSLHCRARMRRDMSGIRRVHYDGEAVSYGRGQSFLFGSPSSIQFAVYNKTLQARSVDKLDYWQNEWRKLDNPFDAACPFNYDPEQPVWRAELRFHHSVIEQFAQGSVDRRTGAVIDNRTYAELAPHLNGLWAYGLQAFSLLASPGVYHAFWSLMRRDVHVQVPVDSLVDHSEYKRYYKSAKGFSGKNVELFLGNFVSLAARQMVGAKRAFEALKAWDCWPVIRDHYAAKGKSEHDIYKHVLALIKDRNIRWGRAV